LCCLPLANKRVHKLQVIDEDDDVAASASAAAAAANGDDVDHDEKSAVNEETDNAETGAQQLNGLLNESIILLRSVAALSISLWLR